MSVKLMKIYESLLSEGIIQEIGDFTNIDTYPIREVDWTTTAFRIPELDDALVTVQFYKPSEAHYSFTSPIVGQLQQAYWDKHKQNPDIVFLGYEIEGNDTQYAKTDHKVLIRVVATVCEIAKQRVEKYAPFGIAFGAQSKLGHATTDPQKMKLYTVIAKQHIPAGYRLVDTNLDVPGVYEGPAILICKNV